MALRFIKKIYFIIKTHSANSQTLYLTIVLMAILSAMVLGVTTIIVGGTKIVKGLDDSVKAFYAADTGIEQALYRTRGNSPDCNNFSGDFNDSNYKWEVNITYNTVCGGSGTIIQSTGSYYGVIRKIEVKY